MVSKQKGGVETNLPNDKYRENWDKVFARKRPMECCRRCGHDIIYCTCGEKK